MRVPRGCSLVWSSICYDYFRAKFSLLQVRYGVKFGLVQYLAVFGAVFSLLWGLVSFSVWHCV